MRSASRLLSVGLAVVSLGACVDAFSGAAPGSRSSLVLAPRLSEKATLASAALAEVGVTYNSARIVIIRPATDTLKDTTIAFSPSSPETTLELALAVIPGEDVLAVLQFKQDNTVIFSGSKTIKTLLPTSVARASAIEVLVDYTGPGASAAALAITPGAGVYSAVSTTQFTAKALNSSGGEVEAPIYWSVSDESKATISASGLLAPKGVRSTVSITATTANGVAETISVQLAPSAVGLRVVQGAGQLGPANSTLPVPVIIELIGADGLPAAGTGQAVTFSTTGGSSFSGAATTIGADGRAQATMVLGPTSGRTYIYTVTVGGFSISWGASATVGTPVKFVTGSTNITLTAGVVPNPIPTLRVADALDNSVPGVLLKITIQQNGANVTAPFTFPSDSIGLLEVYRVVPKVAGSYTVIVEADPALAIPSVTFNATVNPGPAAKLAFSQQPPSTVVSGQPISVAVAVLDEFSNVVTSATQSVSLSADSPAGWSISGTATPVNGIATFTVAATTSGTAKTGAKIKASAGTLIAALSNPFTITP